MSYASVESQKQQGALDVAQEQSRGKTEVAGVQGDTARDVTGMEVRGRGEVAQTQANASMYGSDAQVSAARVAADASKYGSDKGLQAAQGQTTAFENRTNLWQAAGGPIRGKIPYIVGEKGPELFVPKQDGVIVPNHKLQLAVPRRYGGGVTVGGEEMGPGKAERMNNARLNAETRAAEDLARAKYFEPTTAKLQAQALTEAKDTEAFKAQAQAMFTVAGPDGKPMIDPRATALINLYAKLPVTPEYALGAVQHGMNIHKLADSWKDGTKIAELSKVANIPPPLLERLKAGDPVAVLKAENWLGIDHGYDPGVLTGQRNRQAPAMAARPAVTTARPAAAPGVPNQAAPVAPDLAMENYKSLANAVPAPIRKAAGAVWGATSFNPVPRALEGLGSAAIQAGRQVVPGASRYFAEPTPDNPWGKQGVNIPVAPAPVGAPTFETPSGPYAGTPVPIVEPVPVKPEVAPVFQP